MKKSIMIKVMIIFIFLCIVMCVENNSVNGAYFSSDIDLIDENRYPGYKSKIKELKNTYPNIKVLYTGLDWNTVIKNEHSLAHGRNLVSTSEGEEWICQECKKQGILYDSGLYCASEDAVKYMMDSRNFLNTTEIFQFQKLNTDVGATANQVKTILQMKKAIYLQNDVNAINAFTKVASKQKLNAYHLITRVLQEQGVSGQTTLSSGKGYSGNGYNEFGKGYYNLFSINASIGKGQPSYMIYVNALQKAMEEGWNTRAASIEGGGEFVGNSYINVGQNTLYLQKFSVYNTKGQLYWHQYMQNLFGAKSEASILRDCYKILGTINDKNYEFIIPIYENMPTNTSQLPTQKYQGNINTNLKEIKLIKNEKGETYISGFIDIAEWIGQDCNKPKTLPNIFLKSTDGTIKQKLYINYQKDIEYYFDGIIEYANLGKQYYIEAVLTTEENISSNKMQKVSVPNKEIGKFNNVTVVSNNNIIILNYIGDINTETISIDLVQNARGNIYISGYMYIFELLNGERKETIAKPKVILKSTDKTISKEMYLLKQEKNKYYFDKVIDDLDTTKTYYIQAELTNSNNISKDKSQQIKLPNKTIEKGVIKVNTSNNQIKITNKTLYLGNINTELFKLNIIKNSKNENYISGNIYIAEWVNGVCKTPSGLPKMTLKSTDGTIEKDIYVSHQNGILYYFDRNIHNIDESKKYYIEVVLTGSKNIASINDKTQVAKITKNGQVGVCTNGNIVKVEGNNIFIEKYRYYGNINTELFKMDIVQDSKGQNYISGNIYIAEWVNGVCKTPNGLPKMTLKSTDGTISQQMYIDYKGGIKYYFDRNIQNIDISKKYYIEVVLTGINNVSSINNKTQIARITQNGQVGVCSNGNVVKVKENNIFIEKYRYYGNINTELFKMNIIQNSKGQNYISGNIYIAEWVNGICKTPNGLPKMTLKSTDGTISQQMYVDYKGGILYYFDRSIQNIDISKKYYIEVVLTGVNNEASTSNKTQTAKIKNKGQIGVCNNGNIVTVEENNLIQIYKK